MTETVFSCMKRMFGEHIMAKKYPNMVKEMFLKDHYIICSVKRFELSDPNLKISANRAT